MLHSLTVFRSTASPRTLFDQTIHMKLGTQARLLILSGSHAVNSVYNRILTPMLPLIVSEFGLNYAQAGLIVTVRNVGYKMR